MRLSSSTMVLCTLAGLSSLGLAEAPTNPTQGDMSGGASEWLAQSGPTPIATVQAEAQSPFTDVYPNNNIGLNLPATAAKDAVVFARGMTVTGPKALLSMDVQLPTTNSGEGYYLNFLGTGGAVSFAIGTSFAGAGQIGMFWTNETGGKVQMLVASDAAAVWYNIKVKMDYTAHTMAVSITPHSGKTTEFAGLALPATMTDIGSWTYANVTGPKPNPVNIDNVWLSLDPVFRQVRA